MLHKILTTWDFNTRQMTASSWIDPEPFAVSMKRHGVKSSSASLTWRRVSPSEGYMSGFFFHPLASIEYVGCRADGNSIYFHQYSMSLQHLRGKTKSVHQACLSPSSSSSQWHKTNNPQGEQKPSSTMEMDFVACNFLGVLLLKFDAHVVVSLSQLHVQSVNGQTIGDLHQTPPTIAHLNNPFPGGNVAVWRSFWPFLHGVIPNLIRSLLCHCIFKQIYLQFSVCGWFTVARKPPWSRKTFPAEWFCAISLHAFKWREN